MLRVGDILPRPGQPRQHFDEESLRQLAESIRSAGLMQPILVRRGKGDQKYEIIAGERR
ncbi:MAG: ParB/RepB/Spo0J family partition protein, partial [Planctomycetes bacterium]|nr:ParB/RepB/Spo0J family partition protein [Planctomycetota bacterium]